MGRSLMLVGLLVMAVLAPDFSAPAVVEAQPQLQYWRDGPYRIEATGFGQYLPGSVWIPEKPDNVIVAWGWQNFYKVGGSEDYDRRLAGACPSDKQPCLIAAGSSHQHPFNTTVCRLPSTSYNGLTPAQQCEYLWHDQAYTTSQLLPNIGRVTYGGYITINQEDWTGRQALRTWWIDIYILRYGVKMQADFTWETEMDGWVCAGDNVTFMDMTTGSQPVSWLWAFRGPGTPNWTPMGTNEHITVNYFTTVGAYEVRLTVTNADGIVADVIKVVPVTVGGDCDTLGGYVRPFKMVDETAPGDDYGSLNQTIARGVFSNVNSFSAQGEVAVAFSHTPRAPVHAAVSAVVADIRRVETNDCGDPYDNTCVAFFIQPVDPTMTAPHPLPPIQLPIEVEEIGRYFGFMKFEAYVVTLTTHTLTMSYMVANPFEYIDIGDTVDAGCVLGEAIQVEQRSTFAGKVSSLLQTIAAALLNMTGMSQPVVEQLLEYLFAVDFRDVHFTLAQMAHVAELNGEPVMTYIPAAWAMVMYPESEPRACLYRASPCVNLDYLLKSPDRWRLSHGRFEPGGGVTLEPGGRLETNTQMALDSLTAYGAEIWGRTFHVATTGTIRLQIGLTQQSFTLTYMDQQLQMSPQIHEPNMGLDHSVVLANTGTEPVFIRSFCISSGLDTLPNTCYFQDHEFDAGLSANMWTTSSSGVTDGAAPGYILVSDGSSIGQRALLYPRGATVRTMTITMRVRPFGWPDEFKDSDTTFDVGIAYPAGSDFEYIFTSSIAAPFRFRDFYQSRLAPDYWLEVWATIDIEEVMDSMMTFTFVLSDPSARMMIDRICIDDPFDDWGDGIIPPPFRPNCSLVKVPASNEFGAWIFYHWQSMDRFFQCDLMSRLNQMFNLGYNAYNLTGWQMRYWQSTARMTTTWLSTQFFPWLNGHLSNIASGRTVLTGATQCNNIFCMLEVLFHSIVGIFHDLANLLTTAIDRVIGPIVELIVYLIRTAFDLFLDVIYGIMALAFGLINRLLMLFDYGMMLLNILITSWNTATPTPVPGLPLCQVHPKSSGLCIALWVMEHTIFSGRGALFIPLLIGFGIVHLLLWAVESVKRGLVETVSAV